eukprot:COSAG01_NODE_2115_length_8385_cov_65.265870_4_plen_37_part_00
MLTTPSRYHPDKNPVARWLFEELSKTLNDEAEALPA